MKTPTALLAALTLAAGLTVATPAQAACADTTSPVLVSTTIDKRVVKIGPKVNGVTVRAHVTDNAACDSGVDMVTFHAEHTGGQGQWTDSMTRVSGDEYDGRYAFHLPLPGHSTIGLWEVRLGITDDAGRIMNLAAGADQTFRTKLAQRVRSTAIGYADGTVKVTGKVLRYAPYSATEWEPYGGQDVRVVFRPASRYAFAVMDTAAVGRDGRFRTFVPQTEDGAWYAQVLPTRRLFGATSTGDPVSAR